LPPPYDHYQEPLHGFFSRKNWESPEAGFVTMNCPPVTARGLVASIQVTGGVRSAEDCNVKQVVFAGEERIIESVLRKSVPAARNAKLESSTCPNAEALSSV